MEHNHDKNRDGLHDEKVEKYMNPQSRQQHTDPARDSHRRAGISHGLGIFLLVLGGWWFFRDLGLLPHVSFGAISAIAAGVWLLKNSKRR